MSLDLPFLTLVLQPLTLFLTARNIASVRRSRTTGRNCSLDIPGLDRCLRPCSVGMLDTNRSATVLVPGDEGIAVFETSPIYISLAFASSSRRSTYAWKTYS